MKNTHTTRLAMLLLALAPSLNAQDHGDHDHGTKETEQSAPKFAGDPYMLDFDPVTKEKLGPAKELQVIQHEGRELRFNDEKALKTFRAAPAEYLGDVDAAIIAQQLPHYPVETCPVSGEPLGSMGKPIDVLHRNRLVRLCCKGCVRRFQKGPDTIVADLEVTAIKAQRESYPLKTCITSEEKLGGHGEVDDVLIGYRLFRICCPPCEKAIVGDPRAYVAKLEKAVAAQKEQKGKGAKGGGK